MKSQIPAAGKLSGGQGEEDISFPGRGKTVQLVGGGEGVPPQYSNYIVAGDLDGIVAVQNKVGEDAFVWSRTGLNFEPNSRRFDLNNDPKKDCIQENSCSLLAVSNSSGSSCSSMRKRPLRSGASKPVKFAGFGSPCREPGVGQCYINVGSSPVVPARIPCADLDARNKEATGASIDQASVSVKETGAALTPDQHLHADVNVIEPWFRRESMDMFDVENVEGSGDSEFLLAAGVEPGIATVTSTSIPQFEGFDLNLCPEISCAGGVAVCAQGGPLAELDVPSESITNNVALDISNESIRNDVVSNVTWKRRHVATSGPDHREKLAGKDSALQLALMRFKERSSDNIIDPVVGTEFDDLQEAFEYYNLYSWECGFGIRKGKKRYSVDRKNRKLADDQHYQLGQEFNCSCGGKSGENVKTTSTRTDCPAMLRLGRTADNGWVVVAHVADHNHELSYCYGEKKQWASHYHLDKYTKDLVRMLRENNVGLTKLYSILGNFFGSMEKVTTTKRCLKNLCQKINREHAADDIQKTLDLFAEMHKKDPGFVYCVDPDEDGRIKTLMWTNGQSRMQYQSFGDAITFDTTYKTNLYDMPFGLFVGVNNHFQSILFGGVLMTDETIESFRWVFKNFASLMGGKAPGTILTDQCRAMEVAIAEEWKEAVHRWCKWHVLKRVGECVGTKYTQVTDFRDKFHKMLNEMLTIEEFEAAWKTLLTDYALTENPFLNQIYETRKMWVKSFFKGVFCAKMTSTQRSESANHMLKNIVPPNAPLHHFVRQYDKMQYIRDEEENHQERKSRLNKKCKRSGGPLVVEANVIYTPKLFKQFCALKDESEFYKVEEEISGVLYRAVHYDLQRVERWCKGSYLVTVIDGGGNYTCECGLFEHFGLPCAHILRVLISTGVQKLPEKLVMKRWTKQARLDGSSQLVQYHRDGPAAKSLSYRHTSLMMKVLHFVELGDSNVDSHMMAMDIIDKGISDLSDVSRVKDGLGLGHSTSSNSSDEEVQDDFLDKFPQRVPKKRNEKGRPTNKRERAPYEGGSKRTRYCSICRSPLHNKLKCPDRRIGVDAPRRPPTCSGCGLTGHTIDRCVASEHQVNAICVQLV